MHSSISLCAHGAFGDAGASPWSNSLYVVSGSCSHSSISLCAHGAFGDAGASPSGQAMLAHPPTTPPVMLAHHLRGTAMLAHRAQLLR
jgi:hypothetical protein